MPKAPRDHSKQGDASADKRDVHYRHAPLTPVGVVPRSLRRRIAEVLELIRPSVQSDGGDLELVDVTPDGVVEIRLHGACVGCPSSSMTLQDGIERNLRRCVPEVKAVRAVE